MPSQIANNGTNSPVSFPFSMSQATIKIKDSEENWEPT